MFCDALSLLFFTRDFTTVGFVCVFTSGMDSITKQVPEDEDLILEEDPPNVSASSSHSLTQGMSEHLKALDGSMAKMAQAMESMSHAWLNLSLTDSVSVSRKRCRTSDPDSGNDGHANNDDNDDDITALLMKGSDAESKEAIGEMMSDDDDDILGHIDQELDAEESSGLVLDERLASIIAKRFNKPLNPDLLDRKQNLYKRAKNCSSVKVPKVNTEIWRTLQRVQKTKDIRMANLQKTLLKSVNALAEVSNDLLKNRKSQDTNSNQTLVKLTDAIALIGHAAHELTIKRRDQMRPAMKREYASLCSDNSPASDLLFGDDLGKKLKEAKQAHYMTNQSKNGYRNAKNHYPPGRGKPFRPGPWVGKKQRGARQ